jgi:hypothetical protein
MLMKWEASPRAGSSHAAPPMARTAPYIMDAFQYGVPSCMRMSRNVSGAVKTRQ